MREEFSLGSEGVREKFGYRDTSAWKNIISQTQRICNSGEYTNIHSQLLQILCINLDMNINIHTIALHYKGQNKTQNNLPVIFN